MKIINKIKKISKIISLLIGSYGLIQIIEGVSLIKLIDFSKEVLYINYNDFLLKVSEFVSFSLDKIFLGLFCLIICLSYFISKCLVNRK